VTESSVYIYIYIYIYRLINIISIDLNTQIAKYVAVTRIAMQAYKMSFSTVLGIYVSFNDLDKFKFYLRAYLATGYNDVTNSQGLRRGFEVHNTTVTDEK